MLLDPEYSNVPTVDQVRELKKESELKECPTCQKKFYSPSKKQKHCSVKCGSKIKGIYPPREELESLLWKMPSSKVAKLIGVSDVALGKYCRKNEISKPPRGYWAKLESENRKVS